MRRVWVVLQILIAGGLAVTALVGSWDEFVHLATSDTPKFMRAAVMKAAGPESDGIGSVSAGFTEVGGPVFSVLPSLLLWGAYAWMAAENLGGRAARSLAGIHKWAAISAALVFLIFLLSAIVFSSIPPERGSLGLVILPVLPGVVLKPSLVVALAGFQIASALAGFKFCFGDNHAAVTVVPYETCRVDQAAGRGSDGARVLSDVGADAPVALRLRRDAGHR